MPESFEPQLDVLPESQCDLWPELDAVPSDFVLYGGTALALQLGHRVSEDLDFSSTGFERGRLQSRLPFFRELYKTNPDHWVYHKRDNLEAHVERRCRAGPSERGFTCASGRPASFRRLSETSSPGSCPEQPLSR